MASVLPDIVSFCKKKGEATIDFADAMATFTDADIGTMERYLCCTFFVVIYSIAVYMP